MHCDLHEGVHIALLVSRSALWCIFYLATNIHVHVVMGYKCVYSTFNTLYITATCTSMTYLYSLEWLTDIAFQLLYQPFSALRSSFWNLEETERQ